MTMICYQVFHSGRGFFQYQLINAVWFSIEFFPFSWSQPCLHSYHQKLKTFFSPSSSGEKMYWGQGWAAHYVLFRGFIFLRVQLSKIITKCFLCIIIHIFSTQFAINLFYLHILEM